MICDIQRCEQQAEHRLIVTAIRGHGVHIGACMRYICEGHKKTRMTSGIIRQRLAEGIPQVKLERRGRGSERQH